MLFFTVFVVGAKGEDVEHSVDGTTVKVLGQSGKIRLDHVGQPITIDFDYLSELDASGTIVGHTGAVKHSVTSFATQSFTFTPVVEQPYLGVPTKTFTFESPVYSIGKLKVVALLFQENATIDTGAEQWEVSRGDMKFNIELSDWTFCNPCSDGIASFVEIGIEMKSSKEPDTAVGVSSVDVGGGLVQLASQVNIDGSKVNLPSGFPQIIAEGSKTLFVFRFPKFSTSLSYDPLLQLSDQSDSTGYRWSWICIVVMLYHTLHAFM